MKKYILILMLCLAILFQCIPGQVAAADTDPAEETTEETAITAPTSSTEPLAFGQASVLNGCRSIEGMVPLSGNERRLDSAQSVFVFDTKTDTVVYSFNPDMKITPGTLAKLVTALVVIENCELDEVVTCHSKNISRLPGGTQNVKLKELEELTVEQLLHCLILSGANDAAVALSEHVAGNMASFVSLMNDRVRQMGCVSTEFGNVHGLDNATSLSTARDVARIYIECEKNETLKEILFTTRYTVPVTNKTDEERKLTCQNYLIDEITVAKYYDRRVTGGMASYTNNGGASLVCSAEDDKDTLDLVLVILGAKRIFADNGWLPTYYGNFDEMIELLEFAFNGFKSARILYEGQSLYQLPVSGGECDVVVQPNVNYDSVLPADCRLDNLIKNVTYSQINAPVKQGDLVGTISLSYRSSVVAEAELYAMSDVARAAGAEDQGSQREGAGDSTFVNVLVTICLIVLVPALLYLAINSLRRYLGRARRRRRRAQRRRRW